VQRCWVQGCKGAGCKGAKVLDADPTRLLAHGSRQPEVPVCVGRQNSSGREAPIGANETCHRRYETCWISSSMGVRRFQDLVCWQLALRLHERIVAITAKPQVSRDRNFCDQILGSSSGVAPNITEGFVRYLPADFKKFLRIALASVAETQTHLLQGHQRGYVTTTSSRPPSGWRDEPPQPRPACSRQSQAHLRNRTRQAHRAARHRALWFPAPLHPAPLHPAPLHPRTSTLAPSHPCTLAPYLTSPPTNSCNSVLPLYSISW
jgi:four helix bundle protein